MTSSSMGPNKPMICPTRVIVGDVGGTNCRLAVCDPSTGLINNIRIMPVKDFRSLDEAINTFKDALPSTGSRMPQYQSPTPYPATGLL